MAALRINAINEDILKKTTSTSNVTSSIWERLPYNIGMELHHCKSTVIVDNKDQYHNAEIATKPLKNTTFSTCCCCFCCYCYNNCNNCYCYYENNLQQIKFPPTTLTTTMKMMMTTITKNQLTICIPSALLLLTTNLANDRRNLNIYSAKSIEKVKENSRILENYQNNFETNDKNLPLCDDRISKDFVNCCSLNHNNNILNQYSKVKTTATTTITTTKTTIIKSSDIKCFSSVKTSPASTDNSMLSQLIEKLPKEFYQKSTNHLVQKLQLKLRKDQLSSLVFMYLFVYIFSLVTLCWSARLDASSNCTFPQRWEGSWFLSGYQQSIHIKGSQFSYRGKCTASDGNKYLIVDEKGCHRCLVIYEKHKNVLQYKESECEGDSMYMHQSNPSAMAMRSVLKSDHRGGAHPNSNGHSRLSSSDQYIMRSNDDMNDCPPDFCKGRETLQNLCDQIPGDALLFSLFRESAEPVKCPLKGPFIFTYNRGHGECKSPVSNIDSCTEDSRLLLSFQACHDVQGTESTVEELTCLATWKDGNSRYLVGLVSHHHAISNEERYRCFVYEKISTLMGSPAITSSKDAEYKLAQSGDATCNGLDSAEVGSRIMSLRKPPPAERCDFPVWFKGPRHWHALMGNAVYNYHPNDGSMHIIKPNGYMETRALCEQINKQTSTEMMAVVHYTTGCQSGFMCMMFYRRDTHVIEIQTGKQASRLEDACAPDHFDINKMSYITLLASNPDPQICPLEGLYNLRGAIGPPFISSRHKRNHNNKGRNQRSHHHLQQQHDLNFHSEMSGGGTSRKSHSSWISRSKELPIRNRRDVTIDNDENKNNTIHLNYEKEIINDSKILSTSVSNHLSKLSHSNISTSSRDNNDDNRKNIKLQQQQKQQQQLRLNSAVTDSISNNKKLQQMKENQKHLLLENYHQKLLRVHEISAKFTGINSIISDNKSNRNSFVSNSEEMTITIPVATTTTTTATTTRTTTIKTTTITDLSMAAMAIQQRSRRDAPSCIVNYKVQRQLWVGCTGPNLIDVRPQCNDDGDEEYSCHGSWSENGTVYVIARHKGTKHGVCISYRPIDGTTTNAKLIIGDACYRGTLKPPEHHLVANLTVFGKCGDTNSAYSIKSNCLTILISTIGFILLPMTMFTIR